MNLINKYKNYINFIFIIMIHYKLFIEFLIITLVDNTSIYQIN